MSPIEMRSLWIEIKYVKIAARLLNRNWVNKEGLDLSEEVLWVSVGQRATEVQAVIVEDKKICYLARFVPDSPVPGQAAEFFSTSNFESRFLLPFDLQRPTVTL